MHYLITGGSGFIGRALCRALLVDGQRVTVLTRNIARARKCLADEVRLIDDIAMASDVDAVVNLAGENLSAQRWTAARKREFVDSRLNMTRAVVGWITAQPR